MADNYQQEPQAGGLPPLNMSTDEINESVGQPLFVESPMHSSPLDANNGFSINPLDFEMLRQATNASTIGFDGGSHDGSLVPSPSLPNWPIPFPSLDYTPENTLPGLENASGTPGAMPGSPSMGASNIKPPPKIGTRFSKEAVYVLRRWYFAHENHPYPNDQDREILQNQTGLNRTQIANWLANARRRKMTMHPQTRSSPQSNTQPIDIPQRPPTPTVGRTKHHLNPLERWFDSPPEDEPAAASAIARAINSERSGAATFDSELTHNPAASSIYDIFHHGSSAGTSRSSASSFSSANSYGSRVPSRASRASSGSGEFPIPRPRSKRRAKQRRAKVSTSLSAPNNRYQCTFCTETFRTKHDWQRHEKSLHLPLERWICSPNGPRITNESSSETTCAFCGEANPSDSHIEHHNPSFCRERTFSRKDHLKQHLRLVHSTGLAERLIEDWKIPSPPIRSRCGFCGIVMETWEHRTDHLADHFKMGQTMASWEGDWGFDVEILKMVENSIPPYLIDDERKTPAPFMASNAPWEAPRHAYELIQSELTWFLQLYDHNAGTIPSSDVLQLEACRIIVAAETLMHDDTRQQTNPESWLRELITARTDLSQQAQFGPFRARGESALSAPMLHNRMALFEDCPLEAQLRNFALSQWKTNQRVLSNSELQVEACKIVSSMCQAYQAPASNVVSNWLIMLIGSSTTWLANFRQRVYSSATEGDPGDVSLQEKLDPQTDYITHKPGQYLSMLPSEEDIRNYHDSRIKGNESEFSMIWPQPISERLLSTSLDFPDWKPAIPAPTHRTPGNELPVSTNLTIGRCQKEAADRDNAALENTSPGGQSVMGSDHRPTWIRNNILFLNDDNFHRWLARELGRWVVATMSPNNPNCHKPSDEELRHQARCILYDDDDPFNLTAADNTEWLRRFKHHFDIADD